jgi:hypothetical protein
LVCGGGKEVTRVGPPEFTGYADAGVGSGFGGVEIA